MKEKISIIIPVYNVEKYIDRCLESIVNQEYKNIEIILINDGSEDNSSMICDKWAKKDSRVIVIHQKNKGVSKARNKGLDVAKGKYIGFVDPDDVISKDMYSSMIVDMKENKADIVACGVSELFLDGTTRIYRKGDSPIKLDKKNAINKALMLSDDIGGSVCDKLWKRDVINNIRFDSSFAIAEDRLFVIKVLLNCNIFYRNFIPKYFCIKRENSATQSKFSEKNFDIVWSAEKAKNEVIKYSKEYIKQANFHVVMACMDVIHLILANDMMKVYKVQYKEVIKLFKQIKMNSLPNEISMILKLKISFLKNLSFLYEIAWKIKKKRFFRLSST